VKKKLSSKVENEQGCFTIVPYLIDPITSKQNNLIEDKGLYLRGLSDQQ